MLQRSGALARLVFVDLIGSVFWFPVWWYTVGLKKMIEWCVDGLRYRAKQYAFGIWIRNFFVPMYGQYEWTGRLISVFMRFVVIVGRGIAIGVEALVYLAFAVAWIVLPPLALVMAVQNILNGASLHAY
jgi:hypothetical protein